MRSHALACWLLLLFSASCGADDGARPRYTSGISAEADVSTLDETDRLRICRSFAAHVETYVNFEQIAYIACLPPAIVLGGDQAGCERQLEECMALFPAPVALETTAEGEALCSTLGECRASVAALEGCINLNLDLAFEILERWSCAGALDPDERQLAARAMDTAELCADLDTACNTFATLAPD